MRALGLLTFLWFSILPIGPMPSFLNLMPLPAKVQLAGSQVVINQSFSVAVTGAKDARLDSGVSRFLDQLSRQTGMPLKREPGDPAKAALVIHCDNPGQKVQELNEDESYSLEINSRATLNAPNPLGVLHGLQTFLQLVSPSPSGFAVP